MTTLFECEKIAIGEAMLFLKIWSRAEVIFIEPIK